MTWETTTQTNIGVDFETKNQMLSGTFDMYSKKTTDLLQSVNIPTSSGFSNILVNQGAIKNNGIELSLNYDAITDRDFTISMGGNIAFNKTEISNLESQPLDDFYIDGVSEQRRFYFGSNISRGGIFQYPANVFVEGEETSLFYGFQTNGIYQTNDNLPQVFGTPAQPGDVKLVDQNGDGIIDLDDRTFMGNPNPDFVLSLIHISEPTRPY